MNTLTFQDRHETIVNAVHMVAAMKSSHVEFGEDQSKPSPSIRILTTSGDWFTLVYDDEKARDDDHEKLDFMTLAR